MLRTLLSFWVGIGLLLSGAGHVVFHDGEHARAADSACEADSHGDSGDEDARHYGHGETAHDDCGACSFVGSSQGAFVPAQVQALRERRAGPLTPVAVRLEARPGSTSPRGPPLFA